jgi:hypothetical protein
MTKEVARPEQQGAARQGWVAVSERLPEIGVPVFAWEGGYIVWRVREFIDSDGWNWCNAYSTHHTRSGWECEASSGWEDEFDDEYAPTHWMPLPEPPSIEATRERPSPQTAGQDDKGLLACVTCGQPVEVAVPSADALDARRLDWMQFYSGQVCWGNDGEVCSVRWYDRDNEVNRKTANFYDWREAIDAALSDSPTGDRDA